jgi:hypothetical protein
MHIDAEYLRLTLGQHSAAPARKVPVLASLH